MAAFSSIALGVVAAASAISAGISYKSAKDAKKARSQAAAEQARAKQQVVAEKQASVQRIQKKAMEIRRGRGIASNIFTSAQGLQTMPAGEEETTLGG